MVAAYTLLLAPNPSIMTGPGTNTIVLGGGVAGATVIDPADDDPAHLATIVRVGEERGGIQRILITHGHPDHLGGAASLRERLGVPIYAFQRQGVPVLDEEIADGTIFAAGQDRLRALHTPGHRFDHLCFILEQEQILFAGDLVSGIGTTVISPPEGDMLDYLNSLKRLQNMALTEIVPGHGPMIREPQSRLAEYVAHRMQREQQVLAALQALPASTTIAEIVRYIYLDIDARLHVVAAHSVAAHLLKLEREGHVRRDGDGWVLG